MNDILLHQEDEFRIRAEVAHLIDVTRDRLPSDAHLRAVDLVAILVVQELPNDDAFLGGDDVERVSGATEEAGDVVEHRIRVLLVLEQLDVGVEEITLGDVNTSGQHAVHELHHPGQDGHLSHGGGAAEGGVRVLVLEHDAIELLEVHLVVGSSRGERVSETLPVQDVLRHRHHNLLDRRRHLPTGEVDHLPVRLGEVEIGQRLAHLRLSLHRRL